MRKRTAPCGVVRLPAGSALNVNPVLVLGWLESTAGLPSGDIPRIGV